jgi:plastocyanin
MNRTVPALLCSLLLLAVFAAPVAGAGGKHVTIKGSYGYYKFKPHKVEVKKGKRVTWSWDSDEKHNVTFKSLDKHSKTKRKIDDYHVKFTKTGTFKYTCTVHGFGGKVVVVDD